MLLTAGACNWVSLGRNALKYDLIQQGEAGNVAALDSVAFVTLAESGLGIIDARTGRTLATIPPPPGSESVDDLAISGQLLFALDAREPGHLSVFSLRNPMRPALVSGPRAVPVGPFSGVSANSGISIVSGGTSQMTAWRYDSAGVLDGPTATADLGRGQPDVLVARNGATAFVSTHYWGPYFGLDIVRYQASKRQLTKLAELELDGAGFTDGGAKPANFPIESAQLDDNTLLVAFARGVAVIDVSDARTPRVKQVLDVGGRAVNVDVSQREVAVVVIGPTPGIVLLDFSGGVAHVVRRITLRTGTNPIAVTFTMRAIVVAARDQGVLVFER